MLAKDGEEAHSHAGFQESDPWRLAAPGDPAAGAASHARLVGGSWSAPAREGPGVVEHALGTRHAFASFATRSVA